MIHRVLYNTIKYSVSDDNVKVHSIICKIVLRRLHYYISSSALCSIIRCTFKVLNFEVFIELSLYYFFLGVRPVDLSRSTSMKNSQFCLGASLILI